MSIAKEGRGILVALGTGTALSVLAAVVMVHPVSLVICIILLSLFLSAAFFFRDPYRVIPNGSNVIVAPADGIILDVKPVSETEYLKEAAHEVSIFLSIFDVHINRIPISGKVEMCRYKPGRFHAAFSHKAPDNEQTIIGISNGSVKILMRQIAGIIARRIVCHVQPGMNVEKGERFGMIKFGSRTDLVLPKQVTILVHPKQRVRGGETIIGTYADGE